jgi:alpha-galactosidase
MYKALLGPEAAVYGDHVELTEVRFANTHQEYDIGRDFASSVGTGAVLGTKFTWPDYGPKFEKVMLTPEKQQHWKKWLDIYNDKMLSKGDFKDLYIYGYDSPEAYAIEKDGKMYYAFYATGPKETWNGTLDLRGLQPGRYKVYDYVDGKDLGTVDASDPKLTNVKFTDHLLLEVSKI